MTKPLLPILLLAGAALAGGLVIDTSQRLELTNCSSGGHDGGQLAEGQYLVRVTDADTNVCIQSGLDAGYLSCSSGGEKFPSGTIILQSIPRGGATVTCRSSTSTGDVIYTRTY